MTTANTSQNANKSELDRQTSNTQPPALPVNGFSRAKQLLPYLPIGESTLWKWTKEGLFPKPHKLSPTVTAWANEDVHAWFKAQASNDENYNDDGVA
ncbi:AlpA family phage regulatory protein [Psychrobacter sp. HD31]|uniref:helix-turn-helix transcriptional regulator n=1 Tax=Psychrobacter sp. HD31 TaxID=3112003 RepID=UPI003DA25EE0